MKINMLKKDVIIVVVLIIIITIGGIIYIVKENNNYDEEIIDTLEEEDNVTNEVEKEEGETKEDNEEIIVVHIAGEVISPGVISLIEGSRVIDAINEAGGLTENADISKINLAYVLSDAEKVYIPSKGEDFVEEINNSITKEKVMININTANEADLEKVPGIGQTIALRIIEYRKKNGKFNKIEDVQNVSGIGPNKFNKIKEYICAK